MKLIYNLQKTLKNGFYIDYLFKIIFNLLYINIIKKSMFYITDKYLAEIFLFNVKSFFSFFLILSEFFKKLNIINLFKIAILITFQLVLILFI